MNKEFFQPGEAIPDDWASYIENEAMSLSKQEDFAIDNYADREILNPNFQQFLNEMKLPPANNDLMIAEPLSLSFMESRFEAASVFGGKLRRLKNKIREILCRILSELAGDGEIDWKDIIKMVLVALIPALGGGPLSLIVLPILISLIAKLIKRGFEAVCPIAA